MAEQYPITQAEFREWLLTKRPNAYVGSRYTGYGNAITNYLKARGDDVEWVGLTKISGFEQEWSAPAWVEVFLRLQDRGGWTVILRKVQARTALRLLDRVSEVAS